MNQAPATASTLGLFEGQPRRIIVNGYSTSFQWPQLLQRKVDRYLNERSIIRVETATRGGTPIARWINVDTGQRSDAWRQQLLPLLARSGAHDTLPRIVLCQQSLQWVFGGRAEGIRGDDDHDRIERGAAAIHTYAQALKQDGADLVFIAMHIYKHPMEPQIGRERLALAHLLSTRKTVWLEAGPDVWEPMRQHYPHAFGPDLVHPNDIGAAIMAQHWFERLLQYEGREVPTWSREEMQQAIEQSTLPPY